MQRLVYRCAVLLLLGMGGVGIAAAQSPEPALAQSQPSDRHNQILKLISRKEYEQAEAACRALIESRPEFGRAYGTLVVIGREAGRLDRVQAYFEGLAAANPRALYGLGQIAGERKEHEAALDYHRQCLRALPGFPPAVAGLAQSALTLKRLEEVDALFRSRPAEAAFVFGVGWLHRQRQQYAQALAAQEEALRLNPALIEASLERLNVLIAQGRLAEALSAFDELLGRVHASEDPERRQALLSSRGTLLIQMGRHAQGIRNLNEALPLTREYGWKASEERIQSLMGTAWWSVNSYSEALQCYQQALALAPADDPRKRGRHLGNIGLAYETLGDLSRAAEYYQQAIAAARTARPPDNASLINFLINLSGIAPAIGRADEARTLLEEAARVPGSAGSLSLQYRIQRGWAQFYWHAGSHAEVLRFQQAALQTAREMKDLPKQGACFYRIGDAQLRSGEAAAAIEAYRQGLAIGRQTQVLSIIWHAEAGLAAAHQASQPDEALAHYRRAIDAIEQIRGRQDSSDEKTGYFQNATDVYQQAVALLTSLHRRAPAKGYAAEAFHLAERIRSRALLDTLTETAAQLEQKLDADLLERQREIQRRLSTAESQLLKAVSGDGASPDRLRQLEAELLRAVNEYADWRKAVRQRNPALAALTFPDPFTLEQAQAAIR